MRRRLRHVIHATEAAEAADRINAILGDVAAAPRISVHGDGPHLHFEPTTGRVVDWLGAAAAMGLGIVLVEAGMERLGVCTADACEDVYVDVSRNRSRRHCSTACTTRENVAAYRARLKAAERSLP